MAVRRRQRWNVCAQLRVRYERCPDDDCLLLLGSLHSSTVTVLGLAVLGHGLRFVGDEVAPTVATKHPCPVVHPDMGIHRPRVINMVPTVGTEDPLYC